MLAAAAAAVVVIVAPPSMLVIGKRVKRAIVEQIPPRLRVLLRVGVLIGGEA